MKRLLSSLRQYFNLNERHHPKSVSILVVKVRGANVEDLVKFHDSVTKQLELKGSRLVVINDNTEIKITEMPNDIFVEDGSATSINQ
jgi:hypothetical protein